MKDTEIIELFFERKENAIAETANKYGAYLTTIALNILKNRDDADEIVNDTYKSAWDSIPPENPNVLRHYLSRITRNLSFKRLEYNSAKKRSNNELVTLDELEECIPDRLTVEDEVDAKMLGTVINNFLSTLSKDDVTVFVLRYFYVLSIKEIAKQCNLSERIVKYRLSRLRERLRNTLKKEGFNNE